MTEMVFVYHAAVPNPRMGLPGYVASKLRREHLFGLGGKVYPYLDCWPLPDRIEGQQNIQDLPIAALQELYPLRA